MLRICCRWDEVSAHLSAGTQHPTIRIGEGEPASRLEELGKMLASRAKLLRQWADDDAAWEIGLS